MGTVFLQILSEQSVPTKLIGTQCSHKFSGNIGLCCGGVPTNLVGTPVPTNFVGILVCALRDCSLTNLSAPRVYISLDESACLLKFYGNTLK